jgi:uncharacterized repeat protein (TIGR03803 family)
MTTTSLSVFDAHKNPSFPDRLELAYLIKWAKAHVNNPFTCVMSTAEHRADAPFLGILTGIDEHSLAGGQPRIRKPSCWKNALMTMWINNVFLLALLVGLGFVQVGQVTAGAFTTLHSFNGGSEGAEPYAGLTLSGGTLYGTSSGIPQPGNQGSVFSISTDGTGFTKLHDFSGDGFGTPLAELTLSSNTLYGTTTQGGYFQGTVFSLNTDGTGFTNLYVFINEDGARPRAKLLLLGSTLYGTTSYAGTSGFGTVFALSTDGSSFSNLYAFAGIADGAYPWAGLISSSNTLYGTTLEGGRWNSGTIFALQTNGTAFTNLYNFTGGSDGGWPAADLALSGQTLYGTTEDGGISNHGTIFAVNTDGTGFTNLYSFSGGSDGATPEAGLFLFGGTLYGTTAGGGSGQGTVFAINTNGTSFMSLYRFSGGSDGSAPRAQLILSNNLLFGTADMGGNSGAGTVFTLSPAPIGTPPQLQLMIKKLGTNVVLTWPISDATFILQSTTNLEPSAWITNSLAPVVVNGQNMVTNPITGTQQFFRLGQ